MGLDEYKTISKQIGEGFYSEKRSKFLAYAHNIESVEEVNSILRKYKKEYYNARHICYAYVLNPEKNIYRMNDDGEPSGTAGRPIFGQILSADLTNILIVVVRYFGGSKLGTSGLINAYKTAAKEAIANSQIENKFIEDIFTFDFSYFMMNDVHKILKSFPVKIIAQNYNTKCSIKISIRKSLSNLIKQEISKLNYKL